MAAHPNFRCVNVSTGVCCIHFACQMILCFQIPLKNQTKLWSIMAVPILSFPYLGCSPLPVIVTTSIITCLGDSSKPSFVTGILGGGHSPIHIFVSRIPFATSSFFQWSWKWTWPKFGDKPLIFLGNVPSWPHFQFHDYGRTSADADRLIGLRSSIDGFHSSQSSGGASKLGWNRVKEMHPKLIHLRKLTWQWKIHHFQ